MISLTDLDSVKKFFNGSLTEKVEVVSAQMHSDHP